MEDTYNIKAIVLNRKPLAEDDSKVIIYSRGAGKLELTARGTKKIKSKLAGHLEPFNLTDIMVVRGRTYDYVGAAASEKCYLNIKSDLAKLAAAGQAVNSFNKLIKPGLADAQLFKLLRDYLDVLDLVKSDYVILNSFFIFKLLNQLGHGPELNNCVNCGRKISPGNNRFDLARGGLACGLCSNKKIAGQLTISDDSIKLLRLADKNDLNKLTKVKLSKKIESEIGEVISKFFEYYF